ncbi:hypothetical protein GCM10027059_50090 [Myceligenerans halotolerans]
MTETVEDLRDVAYRRRLHDGLRAGAREMGYELTGPIQSGTFDRTAGAPARRGGESAWLRIVGSPPRRGDAAGYLWNGNAEASAVVGVPKPVVVDLTEIREEDWWFRIEAMTLLPGAPVSATRAITTGPDLPGSWFDGLEQALGAIPGTRTDREFYDQDAVTTEIRRYFGGWADPTVSRWPTAHTDLAWTNVAGPEFGIYDWEGWGVAPAGYDAAMLYCHAMLVPDLADQLHQRLRDYLDTPDGQLSQLLVIARILSRDDLDGYDDLVLPVHRLADRILGREPATSAPAR